MPGRRGPSRGCGLSVYLTKETGPAEREDEMPGRSPVSSPFRSPHGYRQGGGMVERAAGREALPAAETLSFFAARRGRPRRPVAILQRPSARSVHVQQDPHRQPRRDRHPRHPRLQGARRARPSRSTPRPTPTACTCASPTRPSASARRRRRRATSSCRPSSRPLCRPAPRPSTPATGFSPSAPRSARLCREQGIKFIGPSPGVHRPHGRQGGGAQHDDRRRRARHPGLRGHRRGRRGRPRPWPAASACR